MVTTILTAIFIFLILLVINELANGKLSETTNIALNAFEAVVLLTPFALPRNKAVKPLITLMTNMLKNWKIRWLIIIIMLLLVLILLFYVPGPLAYHTYKREIKDRNKDDKLFPIEVKMYKEYKEKQLNKETHQGVNDLIMPKSIMECAYMNYNKQLPKPLKRVDEHERCVKFWRFIISYIGKIPIVRRIFKPIQRNRYSYSN